MVTIHNLQTVSKKHVNRLLAESLAMQQPPEAAKQNVEDIYEVLKTQKLPEDFSGCIKYLVAAEGEKLVGICVFYTYSDGLAFYADIRDLFVLPSFRRKGVGSSLLKEAMEQARSEGCCLLIALPPPNNPEVRQFFEKHGFQKGEHSPFVANLK